jgi:uncharacterized membrane protein YhaH (DUF805 family)
MEPSQLFWPKGRTNRAPYWVIGVTANWLFSLLEKAYPSPAGILEIAMAVVTLAVGYVGVCLVIGRLHDIDRSGWWALPVVLLPLPAIVIIGAAHGYLLLALAVVCAVAAPVYVGLKRGTQGPNRFGPDPLVKSIPPP